MAVICDKCKEDIIGPNNANKGWDDGNGNKNILKTNGLTFCLCDDCWMDVSDEIQDIIKENRELDNEATRERKEFCESGEN